ncbi:hypothetical protein FOT72_21330 [Citrobacter amalonaticus]|uniref:Uncharacterized protein n=1 Tax=Citrobacter amalonaticus TaxID=35703 RepID=A0A8I0MNU6_CITAM|nr:hypothetical protein [Citrobacter amalonaticus]HAU5066831.1 hypothetical protein [Citrobacter amalonaticus]
MQIKVIHCSFPYVGKKKRAGGSAGWRTLWSCAAILSMLISANVLPISPECWRKAINLRTIKASSSVEKITRYEPRRDLFTADR